MRPYYPGQFYAKNQQHNFIPLGGGNSGAYPVQRQQRFYVGLYNIAANCYFNAVIQAIYSLEDLRKALLDFPIHQTSHLSSASENTVIHLKRLFNEMYTGASAVTNPILAAQSFVDQNGVQFVTGAQKDAQDFLLNLISALEHTWREVYGSHKRITELISGLQAFYLEVNARVQPPSQPHALNPLILNIHRTDFKREMTRLFKDRIKDYLFEGRRTVADKKFEVVLSPRYLIIQLARMTYDDRLGAFRKANAHFPFPVEFNLSDYVPVHGPSLYSLQAVVIHRGEMYAGHYTAIVKRDGQWLSFDDTNIRVINFNEELYKSFGNPNSSESAYLLFYAAK